MYFIEAAFTFFVLQRFWRASMMMTLMILMMVMKWQMSLIIHHLLLQLKKMFL